METTNYRLALGIGDLFLTAGALHDHPEFTGTLVVDTKVIEKYRDNSPIYLTVVKRLIEMLFPNKKVVYDTEGTSAVVDHIYKLYPPKTYTLAIPPFGNIIRPDYDYYVVLTRCRIDHDLTRQQIYERLHEICSYINNFPGRKVIIGERTVAGNYEERAHNIISIYPHLRIGPNDLDLTTEQLSNTPNIELLQRDIELIRNSTGCIGVGCGGNLCISIMFGQRGLFLCDFWMHEVLNGVTAAKPGITLTGSINVFANKLYKGIPLTDGFIRDVPDFIPSMPVDPDIPGVDVIDLFIKTYPRDYPWLPHLYRSASKFITGFRQIVVVSDRGDPPPPKPEPNIKIPVVFHQVESMPALPGIEYRPTLGYMSQQAVKMTWNHFTDAANVFIIDSDISFKQSFDAKVLRGVSGKTILGYGPWEGDAVQWKASADLILQESSPYDFMPTPGWCYTRKTMQSFQKYVHKRFGGTVYKLVRYPNVLLPSEFNLMGAYMWRFQRDQYEWHGGASDGCLRQANDPIEYPWRPYLYQGSSWLGVDRVREELDALIV